MAMYFTPLRWGGCYVAINQSVDWGKPHRPSHATAQASLLRVCTWAAWPADIASHKAHGLLGCRTRAQKLRANGPARGSFSSTSRLRWTFGLPTCSRHIFLWTMTLRAEKPMFIQAQGSQLAEAQTMTNLGIVSGGIVFDSAAGRSMVRRAARWCLIDVAKSPPSRTGVETFARAPCEFRDARKLFL
ncbi:hypothetical protein Q3G72_016878 [Acer saccharum]|nr:hypothetical protein Q3G72_016878 [Acer saccharum]